MSQVIVTEGSNHICRNYEDVLIACCQGEMKNMAVLVYFHSMSLKDWVIWCDNKKIGGKQ